jgi:hypothetical protein
LRRRRHRWSWSAGFGKQRVDVLVRRRDDTDELTNGARLAFADQSLAQDAVAAGDELHDRLVGFDFGERIAALHDVAFVLQPLHEAPFFHRRRERFHENLGSHREVLGAGC